MIYCVEDDKNIRDLIIYALNKEGLTCRGFSSYEELLNGLKIDTPKLFILDIMLPSKSGMEILKSLKQDFRYEEIPVIMLTAKDGEIDKIEGLDMGADDYITKPFSVLELIARIKAVLRRVDKKTDNSIGQLPDGLFINEGARELKIDGIEVNLTYKEFEILHYMIRHKNTVITRDKLMEMVWGFDYEGETRTVDVHIATLRNKLGRFSKNIETIRNVGYKWRDNEK